MADLTVYLPDGVARAAKEAKLNLSRTLRDAVDAHLEQAAAQAETLGQAQPITLKLEDADGRVYSGRFTATKIAESGELEVFLTEQENVVAYDGEKLRYWVVEDPKEDLRGLPEDEYIGAMDALGLEATVDLDL